MALALLSIDIATMTDLDHRDGSGRVIDGVQDAVASLSNAVLVEAGQLLAPGRARLGRESGDAFDDAPPVVDRKTLELLGGRGLDLEPIACHGA